MLDVAVCLGSETEDRTIAELERHGYRVVLRAGTAAELEEGIGAVPFEVALCGAEPDRLTSTLLAACDSAGVRLVAVASGGAGRNNAARLGLHEVVDASAAWPELERLLTAGIASRGPGGHDRAPGPLRGSTVDPTGIPERAPVEDSADPRDRMVTPDRSDDHERSSRGEVIAVWGPAGSPGRTTIAIAIAAELAAEGYSVALADADTHSGSVAPALGLLDEAPGFAAACRLATTDSLSTEELERIGERFRSPHGSFWVLTGLGRPHRWPELSAERVVATIDACRAWVDFTVLDTGFSLENDEEISSDLFAPRRNAATITTLREADRVVAVGSGDPVGLSRFLRAHVDLLEIVDAERVTTVVNKIRGSAIGLNPSGQVEQTLQRFGGIIGPVLVPHDQQALDAAVLSGKTLRDVAGKSPARIALSRLVASRLLPGGAEAQAGRMRRGRFAPRR
ncbi:hypothetical protein GCM10022239_09880 [Leifsonia bigeumensis]|uniref:CobQ/CobB/MinD/ParA nucleotide binding domain-containing protein n=1 Tax=Leifsonella bigeumensis TaxID=433643 RepID=A0ABP7FBY9_9MICO